MVKFDGLRLPGPKQLQQPITPAIPINSGQQPTINSGQPAEDTLTLRTSENRAFPTLNESFPNSDNTDINVIGGLRVIKDATALVNAQERLSTEEGESVDLSDINLSDLNDTLTHVSPEDIQNFMNPDVQNRLREIYNESSTPEYLNNNLNDANTLINTYNLNNPETFADIADESNQTSLLDHDPFSITSAPNTIEMDDFAVMEKKGEIHQQVNQEVQRFISERDSLSE